MGEFIAYICDYVGEIILGACIFIATKLNRPKTAAKLQKIREKKIKKLKKRDVKLIEKLQADQNELEKLEKENKND